MLRRALLMLAVTAALMPAGAAAAAPEKRCGEVSVGFTEADVWGRNTTCHFARTLVTHWRRTVDRRTCDSSNDFCRVTRVRRWRCVLGGSELVVRLRCVAGEKRVRAAWGD